MLSVKISAFTLLLSALALSAGAAPINARDITISHTSASNKTTVKEVLKTADLDPALAKALEGSDVNIVINTDKLRARSADGEILTRRGGIDNSTINLTVIDDDAKKEKRAVVNPKRKVVKLNARAVANGTVTADNGTHHNIYIDAATGHNASGGIRNSTININLNQLAGRSRTVGEHSILVDLTSDSADEAGGVEGSTIHGNILPAGRRERRMIRMRRQLDLYDTAVVKKQKRSGSKSIGDHSILIDSSVSNSSKHTTSAGHHAAVVDASSNPNATSRGIKSSTVNLTVVSDKQKKQNDKQRRAMYRMNKARRVIDFGADDEE